MTGHTGGKWSVRDRVVFHAHHFGDATDEIVGHRYRMAENVARDAVARLGELESPREESQFVTAVHTEEATAVVGYLSNRTRLDQAARMNDEWSPDVVVTDSGCDSMLGCHSICGDRLLWFSTDRLFAEDRLSGTRCRLDHRQVQHVRCGDPNGIHIRRSDGVLVVGDCALETEVTNGTRSTSLIRVGTNDQLRCELAIRKERRDPHRGPTVCLAHPPETEHGDTDSFTCHLTTLPCADVIGTRGSICCDFHESRIQWWLGSSQNAIVRSSAGPANTFRKYIGYSGAAMEGPW